MVKRFTFIIILFFIFLNTKVHSKDYKGYGEYHYGPNVAENRACKLAFENAKKDALSKVYGEKIFSEDLMRCSETDGNAECELNKSTISTINGTIKKIKKKVRKLDRLEGYSICRFEIVASIDKPKQKKDPNFDFNISINQKYFRDNEKLIFTIEPSTKMFVNIFQWEPYKHNNKKLIRIFPNEFESKNQIEKKRLIPKGYHFKVKYPNNVKNKKYVDEYMIILATKNNIGFLQNYEFKSFQERISEIPNNEYRIKKISYEILKN